MTARYRWYRVRFPNTRMNIDEALSRNPFTKESTSGFSKEEDDFGMTKYRFFWRTSVLVTRLDDDGRPSHEELSSVSFTDFSIIIIDDEKFIRIENPGRSIRELLNKLESAVGLGFTCRPVTFEGVNPKEIFKNADVIRQIGARVIGAVVSSDVVARMDIVSKQGMTIENLSMLDGINYKIDASSFDLVFNGVRGSVSFSSGGLVKVSGQLAPTISSLIEQNLSRFI